MDAATIGQRLGWTEKEGRDVAATLKDSGLIEYLELGGDLVRMTTAGGHQLDKALHNDVSPEEQLAPIVVVCNISNSQLQVGKRRLHLATWKHGVSIYG